jgi:hypothetical protein
VRASESPTHSIELIIRIICLNESQTFERNQSNRSITNIISGGFYFHPTDEDPSAGAPERKKPLGRGGSGVHLLWFRCRRRMGNR